MLGVENEQRLADASAERCLEFGMDPYVPD
jgi:hypothetical protein